MTFNFKTATPDSSFPSTGFLFGADSQASTDPSIFTRAALTTTIVGNLANTDTLSWSDAIFGRRAAANFRLGASDAAAPAAQTLSVQGVVAGTSNTAGVDFTFDGSQSTGNAQPGRFVWRLSPAGSSGTAQNALTRIADLAVTASGRHMSIYGQYTDPSNFSRFRMGFNAGLGGYEFLSEAAGTGSLQPLQFIVAGFQNMLFQTNNTPRLMVDYNGHLGAGGVLVGDDTYDWGRTVYGNNRPRHLLVGTSTTPSKATTVAALPSSPTVGMICQVNNANAPAVGLTVVGGGAANALVWWNGANWTVIGV